MTKESGAEEFTGYWWRPSAPRRRIAGTLTIAGDGRASLELLDWLVRPSKGKPLLPLDEEHERLYGEAVGADGNVVRLTLLACGAAGRNIGGLPALTLRPEAVLIGRVYATTDSFLGAVVEFSGLADWAGRSRPDYAFDETPYPRKVTIAYAAADDVTARLDFGTVTLRHGPVFTLGEAAHLEDHITFQIEPDEPVGWDDLLGGPIRTLQNFVSFALDATTNITTLLLEVPGEGDGEREPLRAVIQERGELPDPDQEYSVTRMLFTRKDVGDARLPEMLVQWFGFTAALPDVVDLHLATLYRPRVFGETRFLFAIQAFEALHRGSNQFVGESMPKPQFKDWRDGILKRLDPADRQEVKRRLGTNSKGAKLVLKEVFASSSGLMADLGVDHIQLTKRSADSRNQIVHLLKRSEDPAGLYKLAATLRLVMASYIMQTIGFTENEVRTLLAGGRNRGGLRVATWWSEGF